jgi:hypothetical protein
MEAALLGVAVLVCPVGMGAMMWFMARGMKSKKVEPSPASVETLREEHRRLGEEIQHMEGSSRSLSGSRS